MVQKPEMGKSTKQRTFGKLISPGELNINCTNESAKRKVVFLDVFRDPKCWEHPYSFFWGQLSGQTKSRPYSPNICDCPDNVPTHVEPCSTCFLTQKDKSDCRSGRCVGFLTETDPWQPTRLTAWFPQQLDLYGFLRGAHGLVVEWREHRARHVLAG